MKILILGPLDYPTAREHLQTINISDNIYSSYFVLEVLLASTILKNSDFAITATAFQLSKNLTEKEYQGFDIHYGLAPKNYHFDRVVCYNFDVLSAQEEFVKMSFKEFGETFYTTKDVTEKVGGLVDVLRIVKPRTKEGIEEHQQ